jgi:SAM-dependent methyltransferase
MVRLSSVNEIEQQRWNDAEWTTLWPKRERLTDAISPVLLEAAALRPGERVLDVGCGGGRTSLTAARAVGPEGAVAGADISAPLTALAQRRAQEAGLDNVAFHVVDMQADSVEGGPFDVALSQFGVMFFDEPVTAFRNIRAELAPGGRLAFACWQALERNPWFLSSVLADYVSPPPPPASGKSPTGPFALADAERTSAILSEAGFVEIGHTEHELAVEVPQDSVADDAQLTFLGVSAEQLDHARAAVDDHLRQFALSPMLSRFPLAFQVFQARNAEA